MQGGANNQEFVVIKYYAHYCKICQRAGMQFKKIATEYPNVSFGKVESMVFPDSANTLRSLGVSKFPFVQIYRNGQCVASFSTGPSHLFVKKVRDTIDTCLKRSPDEWDAFLSEFANEIESNRQAREELLPSP
jgi:thioredoxin-like negative regulator of GroEL